MPAPPTQQARSKPAKEQRKTEYADVGPGAVSGNLTRDPELRFTPEGRAVATLRVAETERVRNDKTGEWSDGDTEFYDVIAWGDMGTNVAEDLLKGDRIAAVGTWQQQSWTDDTGQPRTKTVLVARDLGPSLLFARADVSRPRKDGNR